jgi:Amidohydrolase
MVQDIDDDNWLLGPALAPLPAAMARNGLVFEALVLPRHLPRLLRVIGSHPDLEFVLDHCGKPRGSRPARLRFGIAMSRCLLNTRTSSANCRDWILRPMKYRSRYPALTYFRQLCASLNPSTSRAFRFDSGASSSPSSRVIGTLGQ